MTLETSSSPEGSSRIIIGVASAHGVEGLIAAISAHFDLVLQRSEANNTYNIDVYYETSFPLMLDDETIFLYARENGTTVEEMVAWVEREGRVRRISGTISPNRNIAKKIRYRKLSKFNLIVEIKKTWFPMEIPVATFMSQILQVPGVSGVQRLSDAPKR